MTELVSGFKPELHDYNSIFPISDGVANSTIRLFQSNPQKLAERMSHSSQALKEANPKTAGAISGVLTAYNPMNHHLSRERMGVGSGLVCMMFDDMREIKGIEVPSYDRWTVLDSSIPSLRDMRRVFVNSFGKELEKQIKTVLRKRNEDPLIRTLDTLGGQDPNLREALFSGAYVTYMHLGLADNAETTERAVDLNLVFSGQKKT